MAYEIRRQRRRYAKAFKRRVVAETLVAGAAVSAVARRHGLNANMVFMWRRYPRFGAGRELASFHPAFHGANPPNRSGTAPPRFPFGPRSDSVFEAAIDATAPAGRRESANEILPDRRFRPRISRENRMLSRQTVVVLQHCLRNTSWRHVRC